MKNAFNEYYTHLCQTYANKIVQPINYNENTCTFKNSMILFDTDELEVFNTIMQLMFTFSILFET